MAKTPYYTPRDREFVNAQPWWRDAKTKLQASVAEEDTTGWPPPCDACGALWRRTPRGRWLIDHFPEGHGEPRYMDPTRKDWAAGEETPF